MLCLAVVWIGTCASAAFALGSKLRVQWQAPAGCPDGADMLERIERALGRDLVSPDASVVAKVTQHAALYRVLLRIQAADGVGERTLEHAQCEVLADSAALVIALSVSQPRVSTQSLEVAVGLYASILSGPLPRPALGAGMSLAVSGWARLRWELSGSYSIAQSVSYPGLSVGADFGLLRLAARGCSVWSLGRFELAPCLGVALHRIAGEGFGGMVERSGSSWMWAPELSTLLRVRVWRALALQLSAGAGVELSRQRFVYGDLGVLHRPDAWAFWVSLAPEVLF
jgi:hypothetical protein